MFKILEWFPFSKVMLSCGPGGIGTEEMVAAHRVRDVQGLVGSPRFASAGATDWMGGCFPLSP